MIRPLGLTRTAPVDPPDLTVSYRTLEPLVRQSNDRFPFFAASGGCSSTVGDLLRGCARDLRRRFPAAGAEEGPADRWLARPGLCVGRSGEDLVRRWHAARLRLGETGRAAGYRSVLGHRFDDQTTVVLLNNTGITQKAMDEFAYALFRTV
ncbi:hypothetical protein ACRAWD_03710 [Caulobacter segnis]